MPAMDESKRTPRAVFWSALLHLGLAGFLFATTLSCTRWEQLAEAMHLPEGWSPITCTQPMAMAGPVIQATLVGPAGAPLPPVKSKTSRPKVAPPKAEPPRIANDQPKLAPVKTLPPPPKQADARDQQKAVLKASNQAEQAQHTQQQKQQQRMSELQAAQQAKLDAIFKQLEQAKARSKHAERQTRQARDALAKTRDQSKTPVPATQAPPAEQRRSGSGGSAMAAYQAAIQNAVTQAWVRPNNIPDGAVCPIHIVQIPGGQVVSVTIESDCPFDAAAKRSVKNAVLRAQPLPYTGFEKQFENDLTLNFKVTD